MQEDKNGPFTGAVVELSRKYPAYLGEGIFWTPREETSVAEYNNSAAFLGRIREAASAYRFECYDTELPTLERGPLLLGVVIPTSTTFVALKSTESGLLVVPVPSDIFNGMATTIRKLQVMPMPGLLRKTVSNVK